MGLHFQNHLHNEFESKKEKRYFGITEPANAHILDLKQGLVGHLLFSTFYTKIINLHTKSFFMHDALKRIAGAFLLA